MDISWDLVFQGIEREVGSCWACDGVGWASEASWELIPSSIWQILASGPEELAQLRRGKEATLRQNKAGLGWGLGLSGALLKLILA